jgi:hypothetical protein
MSPLMLLFLATAAGLGNPQAAPIAGHAGQVRVFAQGITAMTLAEAATMPNQKALHPGDRMELGALGRVRIAYSASPPAISGLVSAETAAVAESAGKARLQAAEAISETPAKADSVAGGEQDLRSNPGAAAISTVQEAPPVREAIPQLVELNFEGPGVLQMLAAGIYRWNGQRAVVRAGSPSLRFELPGANLTLKAASVRIRRSEVGITIHALDAPGAGSDHAVQLTTRTGAHLIAGGKALLLDPEGEVTEYTPPQAPQLLFPKPGEQLHAFRFTWRGVAGAELYRFEIARDPDFRNMLHTAEQSATTYEHANRSVPVGVLYWRVTAIRQGGESISSTPSTVRVDPWDSPW